MAELRWATAFLDLPADTLDAATAFWRAVTGSGLSPARGEHDEFATLVPRDGDPYLKVQRIADGPGGIHLDLHTDDVPGFVEQATSLGAEVQWSGDHVVMTSPGGFTFCVVGHPAGKSLPSPVPWWGGTSIVDQVCLDIPGHWHEEESAFWATLTGWEHTEGRFREFSTLERPDRSAAAVAPAAARVRRRAGARPLRPLERGPRGRGGPPPVARRRARARHRKLDGAARPGRA